MITSFPSAFSFARFAFICASTSSTVNFGGTTGNTLNGGTGTGNMSGEAGNTVTNWPGLS